MTGPEHYQEAEKLINSVTESNGRVINLNDTAVNLAAAQVHATLAQAAATATAGYSDEGMTMEDWNEWNAAAGVRGTSAASA